MVERRKALVASLSILFLIGGTAAFAVEFQFDEFLDDATDVSGDPTLGEMFKCNSISSYFVPDCAPPIEITPEGQTVTETQWSIANTAAVATDNKEQHLGTIKKRLNASYGVAMAEAKQEGIEDLNGGASESIAVANASDIIRDWYSQIEANAINYRNRHVLKINNSINEVERTDGLTISDVFYTVENTNPGSNSYVVDLQEKPPHDIRVKTFNRTLIDGENVTVYRAQVKITTDVKNGYSCSGTVEEWVNVSSTVQFKNIGDSGGCGTTSDTKQADIYLKVKNPDGNKTMFKNRDGYHPTVSEIEGTKDRAISNVRNVVENIFSTYQRGDVNASEALGPLEILKTASTSYNSTGYYDYATVTAYQMGLETNDSYAFKLQWSPQGVNETYQDVGQLFLDETAYNGTIETGKQYNVTDQTVWFTRTNNLGEIVQEDLNGTFTVLEMTNKKTGETVNQTSTQEIDVYDSNVTDLANQLETLREQLDEYEAETGGGAGGGFSLGSFFSSPAGLGALGIVLLIFLGLLAFIAGGVTT